MIKNTLNNHLNILCDFMGSVTDPGVSSSFDTVMNEFENMTGDIAKKNKLIQELKDEISKLKGEQGKPKVRPQKKDNHSSEEERNSKGKKKARKKKKASKIKIDREVILRVNRENLPPDAKSKGYKNFTSQNIQIVSDNVLFKREVFYSASEKKTYTADLPAGYEGGYGPDVKALVISLYHDANMTEPALERFFKAFGLDISKATISRMLTDKNETFHQEKEDIIDAGLKAPYHQLDDTSGRVNGKNHFVHILCNNFFTAFFTRPKKDRLTIIEILCRGELKFILNIESKQIMQRLGLSKKRIDQLQEFISPEILGRSEIDEIINRILPDPKKHKTIRCRILEATGISYYHSLPHAIKHLMCDDAPQFNLIATHHSLCWVHEGRHYKKLRPIVPLHQDVLKDFRGQYWDLYHEILDYSDNPSDEVKQSLENKFDQLFETKTGYKKLDGRIILTRNKKESMLLPLSFPFLPAHNNESENGAKHQARMRDVHLQTKNKKGTDAKDTFATIVKTARKLGVNVYDYIRDRVSKKFTMQSLAEIILDKCSTTPNTS